MMPLPTLYTRRLAAALEARGHEVAFVEGFYKTAYLPWLQLPRERRRGWDVFHVHWVPFWSQTLLGAFLRWMPRDRPLAWTFHNLHPHRATLRDDLAATRRCWARADVRFVHSEANRRDFAALGMEGATVVPHGHFHGLFPDGVDRAEARARLGLRPDAFVAGFFGPTGPYKGPGTFLDALAGAPEATGLLFGACPDAALARELQAKADALGDRARLHLRHVPDDELQVFFRACDVVALPYARITTSGSVFFPAAFGVPVVASPLGNLPDVVRDGETGWLADGAAALAERLRDLANRRDDLPAVGRRFHDDVARRFDWAPIAEAHERAYQDAARR